LELKFPKFNVIIPEEIIIGLKFFADEDFFWQKSRFFLSGCFSSKQKN
jgi:hypothetical protein